MSNLSGFVKRLRDIMRNDAGINGDAQRIEQIAAGFPGLDCGACGAPSCHALAEDIVRGSASRTDCLFILKKRLEELFGEVRGAEPPRTGGDKG